MGCLWYASKCILGLVRDRYQEHRARKWTARVPGDSDAMTQRVQRGAQWRQGPRGHLANECTRHALYSPLIDTNGRS
ncbi:unnamed protein product [Lasius platythorax]|uniref:Uncharacterized protein n=1 Tax=Lasius platythorax TaxID=488582 RepID=A0AAV2NSH6_9HYME